jgi:hypothetical protein
VPKHHVINISPTILVLVLPPPTDAAQLLQKIGAASRLLRRVDKPRQKTPSARSSTIDGLHTGGLRAASPEVLNASNYDKKATLHQESADIRRKTKKIVKNPRKK